jgi:4-carboxymuconolactone decarboxylase
MPRFDAVRPGAMTDAQRELYAKFTTGARAEPGADFTLVDADGGLIGPPSVWLISPSVGQVLEQLGGQIRFGLRIAPRARELAILMIAFDEKNAFELYAHERAGRRAGLSDRDLEDLSQGRVPDGINDDERAVVAVVGRLLKSHTLTDEEYRAAVEVLGIESLFELTALVGYYRLVAIQLNVFAVDPPEPPSTGFGSAES